MPAPIDHPFKTPIDRKLKRFFSKLNSLVTEKIAFQYCYNPKRDQPTREQADKYQFIIVDDWFCYPDFQNYYGPSNLAHVIRFGEVIQELYEVIYLMYSSVKLKRCIGKWKSGMC